MTRNSVFLLQRVDYELQDMTVKTSYLTDVNELYRKEMDRLRKENSDQRWKIFELERENDSLRLNLDTLKVRVGGECC